MNIPVNAAPGHADSALSYILSIAKPEDFVVLKLDIDNSAVETRLLEQILENSQLQSLIDEFYFEHHVDVAPMHKYWGAVQGPKLQDTYRILGQLRARGMYAHAWV